MTNLKLSFVGDKLKSDLRYQIRKGILKSGDAILSGPKLSEVYKISKMSVDRALNELVTEDILYRVPGKGTFVNRVFNMKTYSIGIAGNPREEDFFENPYYSVIFRGVKKIVEEQKGIICYHFKESGVPYRQLFRDGELVDGVLIFNPEIQSKKELLDFAKTGYPFIVVGNSFSEKEINYVDSNHIEDSAMGMECILKAGHKKIGFLSVNMNRLTPSLRFEGYRLALQRHGLKVNEKLICLVDDTDNSAERISECLKENTTALFLAYCSSGKKIVEAIKETGLKKPEDITFLIYQDTEDSNLDLPCIEIKQPLEQMGRIATERLLSLINGKESEPVKINLKSELIIRG